MVDRRTLLLAGAAALAGCGSDEPDEEASVSDETRRADALVLAQVADARDSGDAELWVATAIDALPKLNRQGPRRAVAADLVKAGAALARGGRLPKALP